MTAFKLKRDQNAKEFFCHSCQRTLPREQFTISKAGGLKLPCRECKKKYKLPHEKRQSFLGKIPGEPDLQRCLGPCGRVLPLKRFHLINMHAWRHTSHRSTKCFICESLLYNKEARKWKNSQDGFRVCDVCHVDRPRHHYVQRKHTCVFCFATHMQEQGGVGRPEDSYEKARQRTRSQRFACT